MKKAFIIVLKTLNFRGKKEISYEIHANSFYKNDEFQPDNKTTHHSKMLLSFQLSALDFSFQVKLAFK